MKKIVLDIYGADCGAETIVRGAAQALRRFSELGIVFVGEKSLCEGILSDLQTDTSRAEYIDTSDFITNDEPASCVFGGRDDVNVFGTNSKYTPLLSINPFAFPDGVDVLEHMDRIIEVFNASWPMYAAMPAILKDALEQVYISCGWDLLTSTCSHEAPVFPTFADLLDILPKVIKDAAYSQEVFSEETP